MRRAWVLGVAHVVKYTDSILHKEKRRRNPNPSLFVTWTLTKTLGLGRTIYTWELYVVIINIQRNKE